MRERQTAIPTDDAVKMVRAIRDKMYEETKNMTREEENEHHWGNLAAYDEFRKQVRLDQHEFPFLAKKN